MKEFPFSVKIIIKFVFWLFVVLICAFSLSVFYYYKFDKNLEFRCASEFTSPAEYVDSVARWTNSYLKDHPNATQEEINNERIKLLKEFNCGESPFETIGIIPEMDLPLKYFSNNDIAWGSGDSDDKNKMDYAVLDNGYQSFPTDNITL